MEPPILAWVFAHELFDCLCVLGGSPCERVVFVVPLVWKDYAVDSNFKEEAVVSASAVGNAYRYVLGDCEQGDAFVCACLSAEEIDEDSPGAGVLVCDETQRGAGGNEVGHELCGTFFVDNFLSDAFADTVEVSADEPVVQRAGDAVSIEAEQAEHVAHYLEIAVVGRGHEQSVALLHEPLGLFYSREPRVVSPVVFFYQPRCKNHIDGEHRDLLEAASAYFFVPLLILFRIACAEVVECAFFSAMIVLPEESAEKAGEIQVCVNIKQTDKDYQDAQGDIREKLEDHVAFFLLFLFLNEHRVSHRQRF